MSKVKPWHVVALVIGVGLVIYFFTKKKVGGTVTVMESEATVSYTKGRTDLPGAKNGTVDYPAATE